MLKKIIEFHSRLLHFLHSAVKYLFFFFFKHFQMETSILNEAESVTSDEWLTCSKITNPLLNHVSTPERSKITIYSKSLIE